jgi:hypothetical protein
MLMTSLKTPSTLVRYHSSPAGLHLQGFVDRLEAREVPDRHVA